MTAKVLDGKALAKQIESELAGRVERIKTKSGGEPPILATILVGDDPASATYVRMKGNACKRVGMDSLYGFPLLPAAKCGVSFTACRGYKGYCQE